MGLNLTIDQGNSSVKIAIWDGSTLVDEETARELSRQQLARIVDRFHPARALCCSVTGNGDRYVQWLTAMGLSARQVSSDMPLPVKIGYTTPQTLGSDRIAAAVGACSLLPGENLLVVDMGTAVTYDHVNADGVFVGGNIAPGIGMRLRSLHNFTGVVAEISYYRSQLPPQTKVVLTGGWAAHVSKFLDFPVTVDKCLVTKGLLSILLYNENK